jgi:uncharacterized membrane protein YdbT with pleckstrin-like domain
VVYKAEIHWFIFLPGLVVAAIGFLILAAGGEAGALGALALLVGVALIVKAAITKVTTELAVTSKRVIAKVGLIRRSTMELNHSKVESLNVNQGIFGRIFGYGTIVVNGTGGGATPVPGIDNPMEFRRNAMQTIDDFEPSLAAT